MEEKIEEKGLAQVATINAMVKIMVLTAFAILFSLVFTLHAEGLEIKNFDSLAKDSGFDAFYDLNASQLKPVKIAIFDTDFGDFKNRIGRTLPSTIYYTEDKNASQETEDNAFPHGLAMAEILTKFMTNSGKRPDLLKELYLYQVAGLSGMEKAIEDALRKKIDIILYSRVIPYGSNNDGQGIFNQTVNKATQNGIIWVNASGNLGKTTFRTSVLRSREDSNYVALPGPGSSIQMRCSPPKNQEFCSPVRIVLSWNDFKNDANLGTDKDLDLILRNSMQEIVSVSQLAQVKKYNDQNPKSQSLYPREQIIVGGGDQPLRSGLYSIQVQIKSNNFGLKDELRVTAISSDDSITFESLTQDSSETIFNPADNPSVITVGAFGDPRSSDSKKLNKPDIFAPAVLDLGGDKDLVVSGSSNATAITTAAIGLIKSLKQDLSKDEALKILLEEGLLRTSKNKPLDLKALGFYPTRECFERSQTRLAPQFQLFMFEAKAILVETNKGPKLILPYDPKSLFGDRKPLPEASSEDIVLYSEGGGLLRLNRSQKGLADQIGVEIFQLPEGETLCEWPHSWESAGLLPKSFLGERRILFLPSPKQLVQN